MKVFELENCRIILGRQGVSDYTKASYPIRYGLYSEIAYGGYRYQFSVNGEIKYVAGTTPDWPHPAEWLKRTTGDDWVYYSTGSYYTGVFDLFGEYYLPCPAYPTNSLFKENPFGRKSIATALQEFGQIAPLAQSLSLKKNNYAAKDLQEFLFHVARNTKNYLRSRAEQLYRILNAKISVLPPDCRHVDYDVIPLMITGGCMYNCSFCEVKSGMELSCRTRHEVENQLSALHDFFGADLKNYNSIYLGQHDALCANPGDILFAAQRAYDILEIMKSYMKGPRLFLFGSGESFLGKDEIFWEDLNRLPFYTYVNLGLESFDDETLMFLRKPVRAAVMQNAFERMLAINKHYENIEVTANFLIGEELPASHIPTLLATLGAQVKGAAGKGCIYISPLKGSMQKQMLLEQFREIKRQSRLQTFLYLIQRL